MKKTVSHVAAYAFLIAFAIIIILPLIWMIITGFKTNQGDRSWKSERL